MYAVFISALLVCILGYTSDGQSAISCVDANAIHHMDTTPADPETISYTTPSGSDQITFVGVGQRVSGSPRTHTVTIGGQAMTLATTETYLDPIGVALYYKLNPPSGANDVVVNWNAAPLADAIIIWTCSGVSGAGFRSVNQDSGLSANPLVTVPTVQAGDVVIDFMASDMSGSTPGDPGLGPNQTVIHLGNDGAEMFSGASWQNGQDGDEMSWTWSGSNQQWGEHAVVLIPINVASSRRRAEPVPLGE